MCMMYKIVPMKRAQLINLNNRPFRTARLGAAFCPPCGDSRTFLKHLH